MLFDIKCVYKKILLSFASYEFFFLFFESRDDDFFIDLLTPDSKNFEIPLFRDNSHDTIFLIDRVECVERLFLCYYVYGLCTVNP